MFSIPISELTALALAIMVGGILSGILAGLFGIGGGAIIVPVLYEVFRILGVPEDVRMQLCIGTSLAIIAPTTIRSYLAHRAKGMQVARVVRAWAVPAIAGVAAGSVLAAYAPAALFKLAFVIIASFIAMRLFLARENWRLGDELPRGAGMAAYGLTVGLSSSLMGVSGGSVSNMIQMLYGVPMLNAVAASAALGVPISIAGTLGYMAAGLRHQALMPPFSIGFVSVIGFALMAPVSSMAASYGARLAHRLPKRPLEIAFACFLLLVSLRFLASLVW